MTSVSKVEHFTTRILRSPDEFRSILNDWKDLFVRSPHGTPFQHPTWLLSWMEAFNPRDLLGIEVRERDRLIGLAPLLIYTRDGERVLAFAGGGVSDYLSLLAEAGRESRIIEAVLQKAQSIPDWTLCDLTDLSDDSPLLQWSFLRKHAQEHDVCYVLPLPHTPEQLVESLTKRQWANLRNARARTRREAENTVELAKAATAQQFLEDLFRLHRNRWSELGHDGVLNDPRVWHFHRSVVPALFDDGLLRLYRMRLGDNTIAAIYSFVHRDTFFCYLQGFDPEYSHLSPGTQLMFAVIEDAVRLGMRRFDFLRGEEAYKLHWRPRGEPTYRIEVPRAHLIRELHCLAA